jgi:hypothetical protein
MSYNKHRIEKHSVLHTCTHQPHDDRQFCVTSAIRSLKPLLQKNDIHTKCYHLTVTWHLKGSNMIMLAMIGAYIARAAVAMKRNLVQDTCQSGLSYFSQTVACDSIGSKLRDHGKCAYGFYPTCSRVAWCADKLRPRSRCNNWIFTRMS